MDPSPSNEGKSALSYALSGKIMLSAIVLLFTVVLLILFLHLYVRWHVRHRASRRARRRQRLVFASEDQSSAPCAVNRGLDPSILASLPVLPFCHCAKEDDESGECAVCLNEFKEGEKIRCLPRCSHSFHIDCIDMWFHSHSSCPLCRAAVDVEKEAAETNSRATTLTVENSATGADLNGNELCSSCQRVEEMGSSSSDSSCREVRIEIPASRADGTSGEEEQTSLRLELPEEQPLKTISRMVLIRWLLMRDPRLDMERGDGESPVPPQTPTTTTAADTTR